MSDELPDDTTAETPSSELDELIAAAEAEADDAAVDGDVAADDDAAATDADAPDDTESDEVVDWETLAELDERSRGELLAQLTSAATDRDSHLDALRRKQAEFENFRKRMHRDAAQARVTGHADVASRLLEALDDFDRTLDNAGDVDETFLKGVTLVHDKIFAALAELQLARIDQVDVVFDPNRHEAVQQVPAEEPTDEPVVAEVYRPGYELGGRVLRPAMVVVKQ